MTTEPAKSMEAISMNIKVKKNHRWMRCINGDDLLDYVDINIGSGSLEQERQSVLDIADFIGGKWDGGAIFEDRSRERIQYDYYYLYSRSPDMSVQYEMGRRGIFSGQHRNGDYIEVDSKTNKIVNQIPWDEWLTREKQ